VGHEGLLSRCCGLVAPHRAMKALTRSTQPCHQPLWAVQLIAIEFGLDLSIEIERVSGRRVGRTAAAQRRPRPWISQPRYKQTSLIRTRPRRRSTSTRRLRATRTRLCSTNPPRSPAPSPPARLLASVESTRPPEPAPVDPPALVPTARGFLRPIPGSTPHHMTSSCGATSRRVRTMARPVMMR
jgi:hypothetical protein